MVRSLSSSFFSLKCCPWHSMVPWLLRGLTVVDLLCTGTTSVVLAMLAGFHPQRYAGGAGRDRKAAAGLVETLQSERTQSTATVWPSPAGVP